MLLIDGSSNDRCFVYHLAEASNWLEVADTAIGVVKGTRHEATRRRFTCF